MTDAERVAARALEIAARYVGVREVGRNRGPEVDMFIREGGGLDPEGHAWPWCAAFAVYCIRLACTELGLTPLLPRMASVGKFMRYAMVHGIHTSTPATGTVFLHLSDPGDAYAPGHAGLVTGMADGEMLTIEGNTDDVVDGSREGDGVYVKRRPLSYANGGFVDLQLAREDANAA